MGKKDRGFDVIAEAHERANNNINPYYWFNRVTSLMLRSKANRLHGIESAVSRLKCRKIEFGFESKMVHVSGAFQ